MKSLSRIRLFATPWTHQAPPSMGFSRQEYWSGLPFPSPEDLPDPGIEPRSPTLQADSLSSEPTFLPVSFNMILPQFSLRATRHPVARCVCWELSPTEPTFVHLSSLLLKGPGWSPGLSLCLHFCTCFFSSLQDENRLNKLSHSFQTWWIPWTFFMYFVPHRLSNPYFSDLSYLILFYLTTYLSDLPFHIDYWSWIPEVSAYLTPKWQAMLLNLGYWLTRWKINHSHKLFELTNSVSTNRAYRSPINPQQWKFDCFL